jgi:DNA-binding response OmpR family regulator
MAHILVIDDEKCISDLIGEALTKFGFTVEKATDGLHGLRLFKNGRFDLVITDMCMPNIDGPCIVRHIRRSNRADTPVIGISATPWKFQETDCDALLSKPFPLMELFKTAAKFIRRTGPGLPDHTATSVQH